MSNSWYKLSIRINNLAHDAISDFLDGHGVPGVVVKRNALEAYIDAAMLTPSLRSELKRLLGTIAKVWPRIKPAAVTWQQVKPDDWHEWWRRFIKPSRIGKHFWVTPPWLTPPNFRHRQVLTIEPGLAFGTGSHATTRSCGEFIEEICARSFSGRNFSALDVGTGSGILAIIIAKLGGRSILATDNDPVALQVARENIIANGVGDRVNLSDRPLSCIARRFPLVVANLTADTILALADGLSNKVATGGYLILSGILFRQREQIRRCFAAKRLKIVKQRRRQEWITLVMQRRKVG